MTRKELYFMPIGLGAILWLLVYAVNNPSESGFLGDLVTDARAKPLEARLKDCQKALAEAEVEEENPKYQEYLNQREQCSSLQRDLMKIRGE